MKYEEIEKLLDKQQPSKPLVQISFKTRSSIKGLFIKTQDYNELSRKNLWRIVSESQLKAYSESKDTSLARIFNGAEFTRLELVS